MIYRPDTMTAVLANDAESFSFGDALDGMADVAQRGSRANLLNACAHCLVGRAHQPLGQDSRFADEEHAAGVTKPAVLDDGDVDIDDVAVLQFLVGWNTVADDMIERSANRLGIAAVADIGRNRLLHLDDVVMASPVQFIGRDARFDMVGDHAQHIGGQAPGTPGQG